MFMKNGFIHFLRVLIILIAAGVIFALVKFPPSEGRAVGLDFVSIYLNGLIIYGYIASIPFFIILFQAFKLLGFAEKNKLATKKAAETFRNIKYSAIAFIGFIIVGLVYIRLFEHGDDPAGPTGLGVLIILGSIGITLTANYYQKRVK